jgi:hypothetical protein
MSDSRVDVHLHDDRVHDKLDEILFLVREINRREKKMAPELDRLETQVAATDGVIDSAVVLLQGVKAKLDELASVDPRVAALADDLGIKTQALAEAVANTPTP